MNDLTYTGTGSIDLAKKTINAAINLPNPPDPKSYFTQAYNLSKKSTVNGETINAVLFQFTFEGDPGEQFDKTSKEQYAIQLDIEKIEKPKHLPEVIDFDFENHNDCLFMFYHDNNTQDIDRETVFAKLEELYKQAQTGPFVICPLPMLKPSPALGKPKAIGSMIVIK
jgi:hypothetical protein